MNKEVLTAPINHHRDREYYADCFGEHEVENPNHPLHITGFNEKHNKYLASAEYKEREEKEKKKRDADLKEMERKFGYNQKTWIEY